MRRMSFAATTEQMWDRSKTVTRRDPATWRHLKPGDQIQAIEKGMGLAKGEEQVKIGVIEVVDNRVETLGDLTDDDVALEGFPGRSAEWFLAEVWKPLHGNTDPSTKVRRIEFKHPKETTQ